MKIENISWQEVSEKIEEEKTVLVDVREERAFRKCHIKGAFCVPYHKILKNEVELSKDNRYLVYCERGNLSLLVTDELQRRGYDVMNIMGGIQAFLSGQDRTGKKTIQKKE